MNFKEEKRIRDEINYWSNHQELDKFNFNQIIVVSFWAIAIIVSLIVIISDLSNLKLKIGGFIIMGLLIITIYIVQRIYAQKVNNSWMTRDIQIESRYAKIHNLRKGEFKRKLNEEYTSIIKKLNHIVEHKNLKIWLMLLSILLLFESIFILGIYLKLFFN